MADSSYMLSGDEFCTNSARGCRFCTEMHVSYSLHVVLYVSVQMYSSWKIDLRSVLHVPVPVQMYSSWKIDLRSALRHHRLCCVLLRIPDCSGDAAGTQLTQVCQGRVRVMAVASPDICGCRLDDSPFQTMYRALLSCGPDGD